MDRISGLPDEILCHTLSFLSTKEAASTSLLSKRWRNLFAFTPILRFKDEDTNFFNGNPDLDSSRSFSDFVDRALAVSGNSPVKKFSLKYRRHNVESAHVNLWICNVLSRGVLDHLHLDVIANGRTSLPLQIFTCKTIVKLKLGKWFVIPMVPESASLPALKTPFLDCILFENHPGRAFQALLSACHVLEELLIRDWRWCRTVSSATLQRLTIIYRSNVGFGAFDFRSIIFDIPSLIYLEYSDSVPDEYPIVSLDSLVEAKLNLGSRMLKNKSNPTNLIKGLICFGVFFINVLTDLMHE
ncbi:putative F-box/LRR-repeat protein [Cardamine amara subsp. amara]|uniref:F-box/LRR-repeat protein n=1 Tax=Cardamine amara subsp. amara TaxID=228776 RepID=A0ABD0ZHF2_CARAN